VKDFASWYGPSKLGWQPFAANGITG